MIVFHAVTYQNFLGTGNAPISIQLDKHPTTLIAGQNGVGKSTMQDAICFVLFGRPHRNVNKPRLVNSINGRDTLVEITFTTNGHAYRVRRGIKPNLFEIYEDDVLIPQPSDVKDYQATLETTILKLNFKAFCQVVVLGNASYTPFMRLSATARREIIEDLLDIEIFSSMNTLAKEDVTELRTTLDANELKTKLTGESLRHVNLMRQQIDTANKQQVDTIATAMTAQGRQVGQLLDRRDALQTELAQFDAPRAGLADVKKKRRELESMLVQLQAKAATLKKERAFYEEHDNCPECEQVITEEFKATKFTTFAQKETAAAEAIQKCTALIGRVTRQQAGLERTLEDFDQLSTELMRVEAQLPLMRKRLIELETQYKDAQKPPAEAPAVDIAALNRELAALHDEHDDLSRRRVVMDAAMMLLKDNGIKTRVIKHYLPIINKQVNYHLAAMDFPIQFYFDESFGEVIKSRNREDFVYELFSEGQKKRIDVALLLTWRAVARMKNSAATNLLILDEVMDGSLDAIGIDDVLKVIQSLEHTNVFVISHRDHAVDKFGHVLTFIMRKGFTELQP
jgi:DNA repair exonuclease SbcCD ATPase subunit